MGHGNHEEIFYRKCSVIIAICPTRSFKCFFFVLKVIRDVRCNFNSGTSDKRQALILHSITIRVLFQFQTLHQFCSDRLSFGIPVPRINGYKALHSLRLTGFFKRK